MKNLHNSLFNKNDFTYIDNVIDFESSVKTELVTVTFN